MNYQSPGNMLYEEKDDGIDDLCDGSDFSGSDTEEVPTDHPLDSDIDKLSNCFKIGISESDANKLYQEAGVEEDEVNNETVINPSPQALSTFEEQYIFDTKKELCINHDLDRFQVAALVALMNNRNVVLIAPCGSGKLLVFHMGVHILRKKLQIPNGVGICLQPLNNILFEKTNNNPPVKTAFLTISGEAVKSGNAQLSHSLDEIKSGDIGCILGHAQSFVSAKGTFSK